MGASLDLSLIHCHGEHRIVAPSENNAVPQLRATVRTKPRGGDKGRVASDSRENERDLAEFRVLLNLGCHFTLVEFNLGGDARVGRSSGRERDDTWPGGEEKRMTSSNGS